MNEIIMIILMVIVITLTSLISIYLIIKIDKDRCEHCNAPLNEQSKYKLKEYDRFTCHICKKVNHRD
jgi:uncharacterized protein with PIN domain